MNKNVSKPILELLSDLGLTISADSGGFYQSDHALSLKPNQEEPMLVRLGEKPIKFYDGDIFLKSLHVTQDALKVKLFV